MISANLAGKAPGDEKAIVNGIDKKDFGRGYARGYADAALLLVRLAADEQECCQLSQLSLRKITYGFLLTRLGSKSKEALGISVEPGTPVHGDKMQR